MIKIIFGDNSRKQKIKEIESGISLKRVVFDATLEEDMDNFHRACTTNSLFGEKQLIILRRAENLKNLSFLQNISKDKYVILEAEDIKGSFSKKLLKIDIEGLEKIESKEKDRASEIAIKLNTSISNAMNIVSLIDPLMLDKEIEKLETFFINREFSLEEASKLIISFDNANVFDSVEKLLKGEKRIAFEYVRKHGETFPFFYSLLLSLKTIYKILTLNIKAEGYNNFTKVTYPKYKHILISHPYFVFKHLSLSKKYSQKNILNNIREVLELESKIKSGNLPEKEALASLIYNF